MKQLIEVGETNIKALKTELARLRELALVPQREPGEQVSLLAEPSSVKE